MKKASLAPLFVLSLLSTATATAESGRNKDVQVTQVWNQNGIAIRSAASRVSGLQVIDPSTCRGMNMSWDEFLASPGDTRLQIDCSLQVEAATNLPLVRPVYARGTRTGSRRLEEEIGGPFAQSDNNGLFFLKTIEIAVKDSVVSAPSFRGIGFYLNVFSYSYYQTPPAPGDNNGNPFYIGAERVRDQLRGARAVTLLDGTSAHVLKVLMPIPYAHGGISTISGAYLRPYAEFQSETGERVQRYDDTDRDYFLNAMMTFNRESDVLR